MAFDYVTNPTGVFYRAGKLVKYINNYLTSATTTLPAELKAIVDPYESADLVRQIDTIYDLYGGFRQDVVSRRRTLAGLFNNTFLDLETVLQPLDVIDASIESVLTALHQQMLDDSQTVKRCATTLGSVTASGSNVGNGTFLTGVTLDGVTAPISGALSHLRYAGLASELACTSETMTLVCTDSTTEGAEAWSWTGGLPTQELDFEPEGSGVGPGLTTMNGSGKLTDGDFENWSVANTPDSWTIDNGTAGTHIFQETSNIHRGLSSLKFLGTGAQATIGVSQAVNPSALTPRQGMWVSVRIKASGAPAAGTINIQFKGTGYTAASSEKINIAHGSFPTAAFSAAGSLFSFFIVLPATIPSDWKLAIEITGTLSNATSVYFDSIALDTANYHGGVTCAPVAGTTRFAKGDKFTFTTANDNAGVWGTFFRRWLKFQLPSTGGGTETIVDSLAT